VSPEQWSKRLHTKLLELADVMTDAYAAGVILNFNITKSNANIYYLANFQTTKIVQQVDSETHE
jgi:hypothetical protein